MFNKFVLLVFLSSVMALPTAYAQDQQANELRVDQEEEGVVADENAQSLNEIKTDNAKTVTDRKSLQKMVIQLKHKNDGLTEKIQREKKKAIALREQRDATQKEANKLENSENKLHLEVSSLKDANEAQQKKIDGAKFRIKIADQEISKLKSEQKAMLLKKAKMQKMLLKLKAQEKSKLNQKKSLQAKNKKLKLKSKA